MRPLILGILTAGWLISLLPILLLAPLLLFSAATGSGRMVAVAVILIWAALPFCWSLQDRIFYRALGVIALGFVLLGIVWMRVPSGETAPGSQFESNYHGSAIYRRWTPPHLVPEIDQQLMGARLATWVDYTIDRKKGQRLSESIRRIYGELREDPEFLQAGNVMGLAYADMGGSAPSGHEYIYLPEIEGDEPLPVILFLHGSLGNFKGYLWVWKEFADEHGWAVIAPSHGVGNWDRASGMEEIQEALRRCQADPRFDSDRIILAGLSNGGTGVIPVLPSIHEEVLGVALFSPVVTGEAISRPGFKNAIQGKPLFLFTGEEDRRIPADYLRDRVSELERMGAEVEAHYLEGEDHFLFFNRTEQVFQRLGDWVNDQ